MVDETVLGGRVLGLECTEERLLSTEDLNGRTRVLGEADKRAGVRDETSTNKGTDELGHVGGDSLHAVLKVLGKLFPVLGVADDLLGKQLDVLKVLVGDLSAHADIGSSLDGSLNFVRQNFRQVRLGRVAALAEGNND